VGDQIKKTEMGRTRSTYRARRNPNRVFVGNLRKGDHLENPGLYRIIFKWILEKWNGEHGLDRSCSGYGQMAGSCECGNEPSGSI
jgi:hypothetical protein